MSNNLEPKKGDKLEKPFEPDLKKGNSSTSAPVKPVAPPPPKPKKHDQIVKKSVTKNRGSGQKPIKGTFGLHSSTAPSKPEKPPPKTKGKNKT